MAKTKHEKKKELIILIGGLLTVLICILTVGFLLYQSIVNNAQIPEYAFVFFSSITSLVLGYLFGSKFLGGAA